MRFEMEYVNAFRFARAGDCVTLPKLRMFSVNVVAQLRA